MIGLMRSQVRLKPLHLVLFDVDGTLVDSQHMILAAQRVAFEKHGLPVPSREAILSIVGLSLVEAFTVLAGADGPVASLAQAYRDAFSVLRTDPANAEPLYPGAAACLERLGRRDDVCLGIATGKSRRGVAHLLERHGWGRIFSVIQTADDAPSKPHPAMVEQAMADIGAKPSDTLMIGDSSYDMAMARAAGVLPIGVSWGFQPVEALIGAGADRVVHSYQELDEALDRLLGPSISMPHMPTSAA
jgi:phosphoglycolate phosphatase